MGSERAGIRGGEAPGGTAGCELVEFMYGGIVVATFGESSIFDSPTSYGE